MLIQTVVRHIIPSIFSINVTAKEHDGERGRHNQAAVCGGQTRQFRDHVEEGKLSHNWDTCGPVKRAIN